MRKRRLLTLGLALITAISLIGCGKAKEDTAKKQEIIDKMFDATTSVSLNENSNANDFVSYINNYGNKNIDFFVSYDIEMTNNNKVDTEKNSLNGTISLGKFDAYGLPIGINVAMGNETQDVYMYIPSDFSTVSTYGYMQKENVWVVDSADFDFDNFKSSLVSSQNLDADFVTMLNEHSKQFITDKYTLIKDDIGYHLKGEYSLGDEQFMDIFSLVMEYSLDKQLGQVENADAYREQYVAYMQEYLEGMKGICSAITVRNTITFNDNLDISIIRFEIISVDMDKLKETMKSLGYEQETSNIDFKINECVLEITISDNNGFVIPSEIRTSAITLEDFYREYYNYEINSSNNGNNEETNPTNLTSQFLYEDEYHLFDYDTESELLLSYIVPSEYEYNSRYDLFFSQAIYHKNLGDTYNIEISSDIANFNENNHELFSETNDFKYYKDMQDETVSYYAVWRDTDNSSYGVVIRVDYTVNEMLNFNDEGFIDFIEHRMCATPVRK